LTKLLLDAGNTRVKWALLADEVFVESGGFFHRDLSAEELNDCLAKLPATYAEVVAVNVAGEALGSRLTEYFSRKHDLQIRFVGSEASRGALVNGYEDAKQLGADRWVAMVGAYAASGSGVCVVDAGTAVTIDLVKPDGHHAGGFIIPGLELMRDSLYGDTGDIEHLASLPKGDAGSLLGQGTEAAVRLGAVAAVSGAVKQVLEMALPETILILTGGDAELIGSCLESYAPECRPQLVLEGLRHIVMNAK